LRGLLLDTHALLWWVLDSPRLPARVRERLLDPHQEVFVNIASIWEIATKFRKGKLPAAERLIADLELGRAVPEFSELALTALHAVGAGKLEIPHADPFDRVLICQARTEGLTLVSNERLFERFGVQRLWD
jgi:PIN domain nuclease of toxin-antitoxin system